METIQEMYDLCAFKGCTNGCTYGRPLFPFPQRTNPRFEIWLENCGNKSILSHSGNTMKAFGLCTNHFSPDSFYDEERKKLRRDAVPEPYSPTFKRLYPLTKANTRIYDHNYALISDETDKIMSNSKRKLFPLKRYNPQSRVVPFPDIMTNNQGNTGSKVHSGSPRLKRDKRSVRTYGKKNLVYVKSEEATAKASSSGLASPSRLATDSKISNLIVKNSTSGSTENYSMNRKGRRPAGGSREQGLNPQVGGVGLKDKEVGILQETNIELRTQNKLLRKLNGQLKLKLKRSEDRNSKLKIMLEKACSVDGFLDLHRCTNLTVRNLIKEQIHRSKIPSSKSE